MQRQRRHDRPSTGPTRRQVLATLGAMAGGAAAGAGALDWLAAGTPPAFAQKKAFAIRFGTTLSASSHNAIADKFFTDEANKRAAGGLQVQLFTDGQIGASRDLLEGVQLGTVQMAEVSTANITPFLADTLVFDLPYVFTSQPALLKFLDSPIGSEKLAVERFGTISMRGLCWYDTGARKIYNSKKAINSPDDLKGMKIRVEENPVRVAALNAMGAQATPMAFTEVYGALQQKVVDGAENSEQTYLTNKHFEVAPFLSITDHFMTPNTIVISKSFFAGLPKELQDLVIQVGKDAGAFQRKLWNEGGAKVMADLKAAGVKVNDADKKAFKATVGKVQQDYAGKVPKDWWDTVMKAASA